MGKTHIGWCQYVWNPMTGCDPVSPGCQNCYARRMAYRLGGRCGYPLFYPFTPTLHRSRLEEPLRRKKPTVYFVCSMGDLFHENISDGYIHEVFEIISLASQHTFLILTKRPERFHEVLYTSLFLSGGDFFPNVWLGTSVESQRYEFLRLNHLYPMAEMGWKTFVSVEPLLEPVRICPDNLFWLDWVIVGGETGPRARLCKKEWIDDILVQCKIMEVPIWIKQWGDRSDVYQPGHDVPDYWQQLPWREEEVLERGEK